MMVMIAEMMMMFLMTFQSDFGSWILDDYDA